jgi:hypothetical protein
MNPNVEAGNELIPRELAVALIAREIADVRARIDAHDAYSPDPGSYVHSRIRVFLEQVAVELRRAAAHIQETDMADDPG